MAEQLLSMAERLRAHVEAFAGFGSRYWSAPGFLEAIEYAERQFHGWGYATRRQPFEVGTVAPRTCCNLIAEQLPRIEGSEEPSLPEILVAAHLDSIAPDAMQGGPAPGADDNASGCALVLETARACSAAGFTGRIRFVLFGAEEVGLFGSEAYVGAMFRRERKALREVWVLDQVGLNTRPEPTLKLEGYRGRSGKLMNRVEEKSASAGLETVRTYKPYGSDHMPFLRARIPTLLLIQPDDEDDPHNHTERDTPDRLDYDYMARIARLLAAILREKF
ncbi:MAG: M20/M25/M40 family metallo-hydrolase [Armatimonadetes bacterium]|nr:M20/M25/M40 family metallo-hydrolase [Armatimonadota bacterium]